MGFNVEVIADSISPENHRLITTEETYPRIVHSERMTHRIHAKNSASTRAIPFASQLHNLLENPYIPEKFGINQRGMQAYQHLEGMRHDQAVEIWLAGRDRALTTATELMLGRTAAADLLGYNPEREYVHEETFTEKFVDIVEQVPKNDEARPEDCDKLGVHKQLANRGLEAYMWHTTIATGTEWDNYFALRIHPDAQGEIARIAALTKEAIEASEPQPLDYGEWHLPFVDPDEFKDTFDAIRASSARCAASSYNRQRVKNPAKEFDRYHDLRSGGHMSPLEHPATPFTSKDWHVRRRMARTALELGIAIDTPDRQIAQLVDATEFLGNLRGWRQHRKDIPFEQDFSKIERDNG